MDRIKVSFLAIVIGLAGWMIFSERPLVASADAPHQAKAQPPTVAPAVAIRRLQEGNARFVSEKLNHEEHEASWGEEIASGQHPFAIILGCADSRVPPELVFDQRLGNLFVIRV